MKKMILTVIVFTNLLTTQVRAGEVAVATVGGMVGTMAIVGLVLSTAATFGQSPLKGDLIVEAIDVLALEDITEISQDLLETMDKYRDSKKELKNVEDLKLLDAMIQAHFKIEE